MTGVDKTPKKSNYLIPNLGFIKKKKKRRNGGRHALKWLETIEEHFDLIFDL